MTLSKSLLFASALIASGGAIGAGIAAAETGSAQLAPERLNIGSDPSASDVRARLADQGFDAREIEISSRKVEVKGLDTSGRCMEVYFDPATGEELRRKGDDDCAPRSGSEDDRSDGDDRRRR